MSDSQIMNRADLEAKGLTSEKLVEKLQSALKRDGDFPATARVVTELRRLTTDPNTSSNQVAEVILKEPSLGIRVLHLVNSTFYRRAVPIMTVSQAVVQIGMKSLAEMCSSLVLLQRFVPAARSNGALANCLQKMMLTSLLAGSLNSHESGSAANNEEGYLAGSFAELGTLLLAYYFPQVYEAAVRRAQAKQVSVSQSIQELTGLSSSELSKVVLEALDLPDFYKEVLCSGDQSDDNSTHLSDQERVLALQTSKSIAAANQISESVVFTKEKGKLDQVLAKVVDELNMTVEDLNTVVGNIPQMMQEQCTMVDINLTPLPDFLTTYSHSSETVPIVQENADERFSRFVDEIRSAIDNREPSSSIITSVMETLAWGMGFDRVLLLLKQPNKQSLVGRLLLGDNCNTDPQAIVRPLGRDANPYAVEARAFDESRPIFLGDGVLDDGWPIAALPVGIGDRAIGVIYGDMTSKDDSAELSEQHKAAIGVLSELLDRAIGLNSFKSAGRRQNG